MHPLHICSRRSFRTICSIPPCKSQRAANRDTNVQSTREFRPPKPLPAGIHHIASQWKLSSADNLIMVGDSVDDMTAGRLSGAATVLLLSDANRHLVEHAHTDLVIEKLDDLIEILDGGFVGRIINLEQQTYSVRLLDLQFGSVL